MSLEEYIQRKQENKLCLECITVHEIQVFVYFLNKFYNEIIRHIQYITKKRVLCWKPLNISILQKEPIFIFQFGSM